MPSGRRPVFGSQQSALDASGVLRDISAASWLVTALATPSGDTSSEWFAAKGKGLAVGATAILVTGGLTTGLKNWTDRTRPNGNGTDSFPSGHSSSAAAFSTLAARNTQYLDVSDNWRTAMNVGFGVIAAGTAWARVEGGVHYPSDVLFGMALGHFVAAFINDAFMGLDDPSDGAVAFSMSPQTVSIQFWHTF